MSNMSENEQQPVVKLGEEKVTNKTKKIFLMGFFGFLGLVLVVSVGVSVYRVYAVTGFFPGGTTSSTDKTPVGPMNVADDAFTLKISSILNLPVAKVNGQTVSYSDYIDDLKAIKSMREFDKKTGGPAANLSDANLSDQVLFRQVNNVLIKEMAGKMGIKVEQSDIDGVKKDILEKQFGDLDKAAAAIKERYGWSLAEFEKKVIGQFILQNKLAEKITSDESKRTELRARAEEVLKKIEEGADFSEMAAKYGSDSTAQRGGDLGWFGKGDMVPQFETAAFALKKGELSKELVETQFGYHILKTDDKRTEKVKDEKGKIVNKEQVKARHILFAFPTLDKLLSDDLKKATIHVYGKINNPFKALDAANVQK